MNILRLMTGAILAGALMSSCTSNCNGGKCEKENAKCCEKKCENGANSTIETIKTRRSCRVFNADSMPSKEVLSQIAEAGTWAPTGMGTQNPIILVVTKKEMRDRIMKMNAKVMGKEDMDPFYGAPCMMIVLSKKEGTTVYDGTCVMTTLMLAAKSLGVESCWIHRAKEEFESEEGKAILKDLGIEGEYEGIGHVALGYAKSEIPAPAPRKADYIHWIE
ncbi:MAG: nitroreductase [Paludibacteraceae bacterium]|nr:nitroreductase [Paludibacteraceae bacterium]